MTDALVTIVPQEECIDLGQAGISFRLHTTRVSNEVGLHNAAAVLRVTEMRHPTESLAQQLPDLCAVPERLASTNDEVL